MTKWVYNFSNKKVDGNRDRKDLLGGKGANLAEMCSLGLPVPPGFTLSTAACIDFGKNGDQLSESISGQVLEAISEVEKVTGKKFGDAKNPLLFSVRSGARVSMPGMMDTVLNLGLNDEVVTGIAEQSGDSRFAWDAYRRFIQMYSNVVLGLNTSFLEATLEDCKDAAGVRNDTDLSADDLQDLVRVFKKILQEEHGVTFPQDPMRQLWATIGAVFKSWKNARAVKYRELHGYSHEWGTAVNVQSMVFGNMGNESGTGVAFTRNPADGEKYYFGEYLLNAQGEDVVAGIRTPGPLNDKSRNEVNAKEKSLEECMSGIYQELCEVFAKLENHYKDMQDIEFTVEKGKLYLLQTRNGKRTTSAGLKIAVDLVDEGLITKEEALLRVKPNDLDQLLHPRLDPHFNKNVLTKGLPASPGAATGKIVFSSEDAVSFSDRGEACLLVRQETSPDDITGMVASTGILTARGGMTSHAAVVARGMGKPCVAGCSSLGISHINKTLSIGNKVLKEGDFITIDGTTGEVIEGEVPTIKAEITDNFARYMGWADEVRKLEVRTNADNPEDSEVALNFGAQGIGLCRTEHMFFSPDRILSVRKMIFAQNTEERNNALRELLPYQIEDFSGIFSVMQGRPVNIRLLDPPLHEFLPQKKEEKEELANSLGVELNEVETRVENLHEFNPMLGHRGSRLGVTFPEIYLMQARAIATAALQVLDQGTEVNLEIMVPLICEAKELILLKRLIQDEVSKVVADHSGELKLKYKIGTMIELPRAAILAGDIAAHAEFFSFGTNDLTQTTFGLSRDDAGKFLPDYVSRTLLNADPFVKLDQSGVGFLVQHAVKAGKKNNKKLHCGVCGEHGGEPSSIEFCHKIGLDYVSCSPFRVPIARLAAAQAALKN